MTTMKKTQDNSERPVGGHSSAPTCSLSIRNGYETRLRNRRVAVFLLSDGSFTFRFKRLENGKVMEESIRLSEEAVAATFDCVCNLTREFGPLGSLTANAKADE